MSEKYRWFQEPVRDDPDLYPRESAAGFDTVETAVWDLLLHLNSPRGNCIIRAGIRQPVTPESNDSPPKTLLVHLGNALALQHSFRRVLARRGAAAPPIPGDSRRPSHLTPVP